MQEKHTAAVKNKLYVLTIEEETATEKYERFIKVNEEATKEIIPEIKGSGRYQRCTDVRIHRAKN